MSEIKAGDKVEVITDSAYFKVGQILTVTRVDGDGDIWENSYVIKRARVRKVEEPPQPEKKGTSMRFKSWVFKHSPAKKHLTLADVPEADDNGKELWYGTVYNNAFGTGMFTVCKKNGVVYQPTSVGPYHEIPYGKPENLTVFGVVNRPGQRNVLPDVGSSVLSLNEVEPFRCIMYPEGSSEHLTYFVLWKDSEGTAFGMAVNGSISTTYNMSRKGQVLDLVAEQVDMELNHA